MPDAYTENSCSGTLPRWPPCELTCLKGTLVTHREAKQLVGRRQRNLNMAAGNRSHVSISPSC